MPFDLGRFSVPSLVDRLGYFTFTTFGDVPLPLSTLVLRPIATIVLLAGAGLASGPVCVSRMAQLHSINSSAVAATILSRYGGAA